MIGLLDIGGTKLAAAVAGSRGLGHVVREPTPPDRPTDALAGMLDRVREGSPLSAIGIAVPGPFDREGRALVSPPSLPASWWGLQLGEALGERFGCPVSVENDANCAALAEAVAGVGRNSRTLVYYTVSTGIGSGVVRDRRVAVARHDTEGGHQVLWPEWLGGRHCHCGGAGCLEALASGRAIRDRFGVLAEHLEDPSAWEDVGRWLGLAVANATTLLDPDMVVFGGGVCRSWARFAPALLATVRDHVRLQPAPSVARGTLLEDERNLIGALEIVRSEHGS